MVRGWVGFLCVPSSSNEVSRIATRPCLPPMNNYGRFLLHLFSSLDVFLALARLWAWGSLCFRNGRHRMAVRVVLIAIYRSPRFNPRELEIDFTMRSMVNLNYNIKPVSSRSFSSKISNREIGLLLVEFLVDIETTSRAARPRLERFASTGSIELSTIHDAGGGDGGDRLGRSFCCAASCIRGLWLNGGISWMNGGVWIRCV